MISWSRTDIGNRIWPKVLEWENKNKCFKDKILKYLPLTVKKPIQNQ